MGERKMNNKLRAGFSYVLKDLLSSTLVFFAIYYTFSLAAFFLFGNFTDIKDLSIGGAEFATLFFLFLLATFSFSGDFQFLLREGLDRREISKVLIFHGLFASLMTLVIFFIMNFFLKTILAYLNVKITTVILGEGVLSLPHQVLMIFLLLLSAYFIGLTIGTINYRLDKNGKKIFWGGMGLMLIVAFLVGIVPNFAILASEEYLKIVANPIYPLILLCIITFNIGLHVFLIQKTEVKFNA